MQGPFERTRSLHNFFWRPAIPTVIDALTTAPALGSVGVFPRGVYLVPADLKTAKSHFVRGVRWGWKCCCRDRKAVLWYSHLGVVGVRLALKGPVWKPMSSVSLIQSAPFVSHECQGRNPHLAYLSRQPEAA